MNKYTTHETETVLYFMRYKEIHPQGRKMSARIIAESYNNPENTHLYRKAIQRLVEEGLVIHLKDGGFTLTDEAKKQCSGKAIQAIVQRPKYFMKVAGVLKKKVPRKSDMKELQESIKGASFSLNEERELKKKSRKILNDVPTTEDNEEFKALINDSLED